ncbi:syntaxin 7-like protein [Achlya hypogyna]|uniref:Syntaxin 7-like protein n=1 Tax=Achlya hypogyna TaxID=1202772 RepID=A0A1V9ZLX7_ACHHY|nr:syntaxin 7-like protein [Achlya hypogyna]
MVRDSHEKKVVRHLQGVSLPSPSPGPMYDSFNSPRNNKDGLMDQGQYEQLLSEVSKAVGQFNSTIRSIDQKVSLYGTSLDSRANHEKLNELVDKGNKLVGKIQKRLKLLNDDVKNKSGAKAKARATAVRKLSSDFKSQLELFQKSCENVVASETQAVDQIRRSSSSFVAPKGDTSNGNQFFNYNEDQIYAQAQVTTYDEDDMMRREEDIIHINHQLREINAAYKEIDGLVQDQGEVIVEITDNIDNAHENAEEGLNQVKQADMRKSYCVCTKRKMICYGVLGLILVLLILTLVLAIGK